MRSNCARTVTSPLPSLPTDSANPVQLLFISFLLVSFGLLSLLVSCLSKCEKCEINNDCAFHFFQMYPMSNQFDLLCEIKPSHTHTQTER